MSLSRIGSERQRLRCHFAASVARCACGAAAWPPQPQSRRDEQARRAQLLRAIARSRALPALAPGTSSLPPPRGCRRCAERCLCSVPALLRRRFWARPIALDAGRRQEMRPGRSPGAPAPASRVTSSAPASGSSEQLVIVVADQRRGPGRANRARRGGRGGDRNDRGAEARRAHRLDLLGLGCSYKEIAQLRGWSWTKVQSLRSARAGQGQATARRG